jgi:hypothetical protein
MNSVHLHQKLVKQLQTIGLQIGKTRRENLALWCQALAVSPNCHLATLALGLPLPGQRENLIQRLRRFLKDNPRPTGHCPSLAPRSETILDRTDFPGLEELWF